ncbi:hypothetical protein N7G274_005659 [Stereocaulon virgatum]|uniref:Uncharacterized protein n=1 Tax=Stereocaulon virgatum TaxID=373712 RepID=A0ABR4A8P7_9LECA
MVFCIFVSDCLVLSKLLSSSMVHFAKSSDNASTGSFVLATSLLVPKAFFAWSLLASSINALLLAIAACYTQASTPTPYPWYSGFITCDCAIPWPAQANCLPPKAPIPFMMTAGEMILPNCSLGLGTSQDFDPSYA